MAVMEDILGSRPSLFLTSRLAGLVQKFTTRLQQNLHVRNSTWKIDPFGKVYQRGFRVRALSDFEKIEASACNEQSKRGSTSSTARKRTDSVKSLQSAIEELDGYVCKHGDSFTDAAANDHTFLSHQQTDLAENFSKRASSAHAAQVFNLSCMLIDRLQAHAGSLPGSPQDLGINSLHDSGYVTNLMHLLRRLRYALFMSLVNKSIGFLDGIAAQLSLLSKQRPRKPENDWFSECHSLRGPLSTTLPWNIRHSLAVLWGVCWMFYPSAVSRDDAAPSTVVRGAGNMIMTTQQPAREMIGPERSHQRRPNTMLITGLPDQAARTTKGLSRINTQFIPKDDTHLSATPRFSPNYQLDSGEEELGDCILGAECEYSAQPHAFSLCNRSRRRASQNGLGSSPQSANHVVSAPPHMFPQRIQDYGSGFGAGTVPYNNSPHAPFDHPVSYVQSSPPDEIPYSSASSSYRHHQDLSNEATNFALSLTDYDEQTADLDLSENFTPPSTSSHRTSIDYANGGPYAMPEADIEPGLPKQQGGNVAPKAASQVVWNDGNIHDYKPRRVLAQPRVPTIVAENETTWYVCDRNPCNVKEAKNPRKRWKRESDLNRHLDRHDRPWVCPYTDKDDVKCPFAGTCPGDLGRHLRVQHQKVHGWWCPVDQCNRSQGSKKRKHGELEPEPFTRYDNLRSHVKQTHKDVNVDSVAPPKKRARQPTPLSPIPRRSTSHSSLENREWRRP